MNIAVITGASSGLGIEYLKILSKKCVGIDEIWIIARREERLNAIAERIGFRIKILPLPLDLTKDESYSLLKERYIANECNVRILINCSGRGTLENFAEGDYKDEAVTCDLNVKGLTCVTSVTVPFMKKGAVIINVSSIASFVPTPRMSVYCGTKSYVTAFSRALREELKQKEINVLAVCPGPMNTEFLDVAKINGNSHTFDILPRTIPYKIAENSIIAAYRGKSVYTDDFFYKFYRCVAKVVPHSILMNFTKC